VRVNRSILNNYNRMPNLAIHESVEISPAARIHAPSRGSKINIGPHSCIYDFSRMDMPIRLWGVNAPRGGVKIADDVWIRANSTILDGAQVGRGAIVAAGSVVTGQVDEFAVYAGAPARKIKDRIPSEI
jgi:acetyltransferase-like isoleucine patch superfamily enzyme